MQELARHRISSKGLAGCVINTAAPVGSTFNIPFYVFDSGVPAANATVNRTVVITESCASGENFCPDLVGGYFCT
jgi:hypothetical protein